MTEQFYILEILFAAILLSILYFMIKHIVKKTIKKEIKDIKAPLEVLANYLVQQSNSQVEIHDQTPVPQAGPQGPVADISEEFVELKNANKINAYNLRVQKLRERYKDKKINLQQYNEELSKLKKEYGLTEDNPAI